MMAGLVRKGDGQSRGADPAMTDQAAIKADATHILVEKCLCMANSTARSMS